MAQLNIYVPENLVRLLRKRAKVEGKSLSLFVSNIIEEKLQPQGWHDDFFRNVMGSWRGRFPHVERPLPEKRGEL